MRQAVLTGSATRAGVSGLKVAGKTGSSQIDGQENTNAWFIGFIQDKGLPYALCIVVADGGEGGRSAAPPGGQYLQIPQGAQPRGIKSVDAVITRVKKREHRVAFP